MYFLCYLEILVPCTKSCNFGDPIDTFLFISILGLIQLIKCVANIQGMFIQILLFLSLCFWSKLSCDQPLWMHIR